MKTIVFRVRSYFVNGIERTVPTNNINEVGGMNLFQICEDRVKILKIIVHEIFVCNDSKEKPLSTLIVI